MRLSLCVCVHVSISAGIEEIGVAIEEPFALLPLKDIIKDIEKDLWAITASRKEVSGCMIPCPPVTCAYASCAPS